MVWLAKTRWGVKILPRYFPPLILNVMQMRAAAAISQMCRSTASDADIALPCRPFDVEGSMIRCNFDKAICRPLILENFHRFRSLIAMVTNGRVQFNNTSNVNSSGRGKSDTPVFPDYKSKHCIGNRKTRGGTNPH